MTQRLQFLYFIPLLLLELALGYVVLKLHTNEVMSLEGIIVFYVVAQCVITALVYIGYYFLVAKPANTANRMIKTIHENKDLTSKVPEFGMPDISELISSFNQITQDFDELCVKVKATNARLEPMAMELTDTNMGIYQRNHVQQSHNQNISNTLQEIEASAVNIDNSVTQINQATEDSRQTLEASEQSVDQSVATIHKMAESTLSAESISKKLNDSSSQIGDVIGMINTIAEQTNLLALNAAIEAARAGEAGRGFAVVADEVRNLSVQTQQSTLKIDEMVKEIQRDVDAVMNTMTQNRAHSEDSVESISQVKDHFDHIRGQVAEIIQKSNNISEAIVTNKKLINQIIEENNEMNLVNRDIINFTKNSAISEQDLIKLGQYMDGHFTGYVLSQKEFDKSLRKKKTASQEQIKKDDEDIELF